MERCSFQVFGNRTSCTDWARKKYLNRTKPSQSDDSQKDPFESDLGAAAMCEDDHMELDSESQSSNSDDAHSMDEEIPFTDGETPKQAQLTGEPKARTRLAKAASKKFHSTFLISECEFQQVRCRPMFMH